MIWCKNFALLAFLLALSLSSNASSSKLPQDGDLIDLTPPADLTTEKGEDEHGTDQIVGQSLFPPALGQSFLPNPLNLFSAMFPALNSLLLMGNLFPTASLLGKPSLLGSTHQLVNDEVPDDSKVVLVLAEDRNPHAAIRAAHQEAARTIRQNDMFSQFLPQFGQADFGQMLSQSLEQIQQQNPNQLLQQNAGQLLQQFVPQEFSQTMGQLLSQTFQQFPGLDLSQLPMLGQAPPPPGDPSAGSALSQAEGEAAASEGEAAAPAPVGFQFPNFQSAIDAGTQMLGQAFQQQKSDPGFQLPNLQSAFDASTQMLGQAFQQQNSDPGFQLPNLQSAFDAGTQMLGQAFQQQNRDPGFQLPNLQSTFDAGTQLLGQAFQQQNSDPGFQLPNLQSAFDAGTQMLGQAFQQGNADAVAGGFQLPNLQSVIDTSNQMLSQGGSLINLRPLKSLDPSRSAADTEPAPSQISEVRVKPDAISIADHDYKMEKDVNLDELKMTSALQKALLHKKLPILWFRIPAGTPEKDHDLEMENPNGSKHKNIDEKLLQTKLQAFQRQVITELKLLQDIERQAKEMRAASLGATLETFKGNGNTHSSLLSKIPIHEITHSDIEKALNDDYVKKLLHKAAITNHKGAGKTAIYTPSSVNIKRQTSKSVMTPRQMTRDDIVRLMAYAYRMANANGIRLLESSESKKPMSDLESDGNQASGGTSKNTDREGPTDAKAPINRQWLDEEKQNANAKAFKQDPTLMHMSRQMQQNMGRQWLDEQKQPRTYQSQEQVMSEHQCQAMEESPQMHSQYQRLDHKSDLLNWKQENSQMPMQRQWVDHPQILQNPSMPPTSSQSADGRMWAEQQPQVPMQQPMMMQQMQMPQMVAQQAPMEMRQMPMHMPMMMQQPRVTLQDPPILMQQTPMITQQPQTEVMPQMRVQGGTMMMQQMLPDTQQQTQEQDIVGEATPQMPENAGKARFKGNLFGILRDNITRFLTDSFDRSGGFVVDEFDIFGLGGGGHKGKKQKSGSHGVLRPTIINYYYNAGGRPSTYGRGGYGGVSVSYGDGSLSYGSSSKPSYGVSYGAGAGGSYYAPNPYAGNAPSYGGYGAGAGGSYSSTGSYRTAVGDEEIRAMLQEHAHMKMMSDTDHNPVTTAVVPNTTTYQANSMAIEDINQKSPTSQTETSSISDKLNFTTTKTTITTTLLPPTTTSSKLTRLDCKLRLNGILDRGKTHRNICIRHKRNANYGTLQAIDTNSLKELRETYKDSLKEITLNPEEDPAEALMRYNIASIRAALEHANQAPMEVSTGGGDASTIEAHNNDAYYDSSHMRVLNHGPPHSHVLSEPNLYVADQHSHHNNHKFIEKIVREPANVQPEMQQQQRVQQSSDKSHAYEQEYKILKRKQDHVKPLDNENISLVITDPEEPQLTKVSKVSETQAVVPGSSETELRAVLELIKQQMQTCCDKCRDRILSNIKTNIKELHSHESFQKENQMCDEAVRKHSKTAASALNPNSKRCRDDEQFEKWLREMEAKGYKSKYLTKSHHWQYLNSGKLALAVESNEYDQHTDNRVMKKSSEHSFKRYSPPSTPMYSEERKSKKFGISNKSKGKAFGKKLPDLNYSIKEHVHVVNDELRHLKQYSEEVTLSPYAMRGKFKNISLKKNSGTTAATLPVKFNAMSEQRSPLSNTVAESKAKVGELLSLLYDLSPRTESTTNGKPTQLSVVVMPIMPVTSTVGPGQVTTTARARTKRIRSQRKQKEENDTPPKVTQSSSPKH